MPERCPSCGGVGGGAGGVGGVGSGYTGPSGGPPPQRKVQVTAKVLFGSVAAIANMKREEKAARASRRPQ